MRREDGAAGSACGHTAASKSAPRSGGWCSRTGWGFAVPRSSRARCPSPRELLGTAKPDRKSTRLNSSHDQISYAVFCLKKKKHTSELQSRSDLVCRLLLEKKKEKVRNHVMVRHAKLRYHPLRDGACNILDVVRGKKSTRVLYITSYHRS